MVDEASISSKEQQHLQAAFLRMFDEDNKAKPTLDEPEPDALTSTQDEIEEAERVVRQNFVQHCALHDLRVPVTERCVAFIRYLFHNV